MAKLVSVIVSKRLATSDPRLDALAADVEKLNARVGALEKLRARLLRKRMPAHYGFSALLFRLKSLWGWS